MSKAVALLVLGVLLLYFRTHVNAEDLRVGSILPISSFPDEGVDAQICMLAGLNRYGKNIEGGHNLVWEPKDTYHLDDASQPLVGLTTASTLLKLDIVTLFGAWNSAVSIQTATLTAAIGVLQFCGASTSSSLSEKKNYPNFVRAIGNNNLAMTLQADVVKHYGWTKVGIITTDDAFAFDQATVFRKRCQELNIEVKSLEVLPFDILRLDKVSLVAPKLQAIKDAGIKIICLPATAQDARVIIEEAEKLNMIGVKEYMWVTGNGWLTDALFSGGWDHQASLVGATGLSFYFADNNEFKQMTADYIATASAAPFNRAKTVPDVWAPMYYDAALHFVTALNATIKRLTALNIPVTCLRSQSIGTASCQIPTSERDAIMADGEAKQYNGVVEFMKLFKDDADTYGPYAQQPNVILLQEFYRVDIQGSTVRLKLDSNGDCSNSFTIVNFKQASARSGSGKNAKATYTFDSIGTVDQFSGISITKQTVFPGGTFEKPNYEVTPDSDPVASSSSSDNTPLYAAAGGGALAIIIIGVIIWWRMKVMKRNAMMNNMTWLIQKEEVEIREGGKHDASRSAFTLTSKSAKSLNSRGSSARSHKSMKPIVQLGVFNGDICAFKIVYIEKLDVTEPFILESLFLIREARCANLAAFVGVVVSSPENMILQEYCEKGSLEDLIHSESLDLDSIFVFSIAADICKGLQYLHKSEIGAHGRVKPSNCLVDRRWTCKLNDYGISCLYEKCLFPVSNEYELNKRLLWTAPELLDETREFYEYDMEAIEGTTEENEIIKVSKEHANREYPMSQEGDIWGVGIVIGQMITRTMPYEELLLEPNQIVEGLKDGSIEPGIDNDVDEFDKIKAFALDCTANDADERPTAKACVSTIGKINPHKGSLTDNMAKMLENYAHNLEKIVAERTSQLAETTEKVKSLLYEMLPVSVADKLIAGESMSPEAFECVTIFFSDIVGFTKIAGSSTPIEVVNFLNALYNSFDATLPQFDVYKVETIGDTYMIVSGLPVRNGNDHVAQICITALHLMANMTDFEIPHLPGKQCQLRVGIHSGAVVAGVVGLKMPRYCLFGDTVNTASRMESGGYALKIHLSDKAAGLIQQYHPNFELECRGEIQVKGKGAMTTYWLKGEMGFTRQLPDQSRAASKEEHEFK
eukprot:Nk52_evm22s236 gene=Nk52_evmTU22s236